MKMLPKRYFVYPKGGKSRGGVRITNRPRLWGRWYMYRNDRAGRPGDPFFLNMIRRILRKEVIHRV